MSTFFSSSSAKASAAMEPQARLKRIADTASGVTVNPTVKAITYLRTGSEMYRSARNYMDDGSPENAYILYMRFLTIFVEKILNHPGYKEISSEQRQLIKRYCREILPEAEAIKKKLLEQYRIEHEEYLVEYKKLQERMEEEERRRRELAKAKEAERLRQESEGIYRVRELRDSSPPKIPENQLFKYVPPAPSIPNPSPYASAALNSLTDYNDLYMWDNNGPTGPGPAAVPTPLFDRSIKPARILSPVCSGLRQLLIPGDIPTKFLNLARSNTNKNCETCGILCGKIMREKLVITHMVIPKQTGTSDSCCMLNEEEIVDFQDKANLITFGWIHTHPSQTAFLSSVDLHTQYSYQLMMPEAVAIVCAPSHNQTGIYQINPTVGMETIGKCAESTVFHPHPETKIPLFHESSHAVIDNDRTVTVQDLRHSKK